MERYTAARPDIFFTGKDGMLRSNRAAAQVAGLYGIDLFLGGTLQMDYEGNSSTVTGGRLSGFGGAPNMGNSTAAGAILQKHGEIWLRLPVPWPPGGNWWFR